MLDYLTWRGDIAFYQDPFNEVDALLLSQLTYVDFGSILSSSQRKTIRELSDLFFADRDLPEEGLKKYRSYILKKMADSRRFSRCLIHHYTSKLLNEDAEQFAAMMIDLPDHTTVVAFRGTDETLIGWKEDLILSYGSIFSQKDALDYVNQYCNSWRKYRFVGHSKGGNLALYAAMKCDEKIRKKIIQIISNDGPGLMPGTYEPEEFERIKDLCTLIVPEKDGIGTIYEMDRKKKIVRTSASNIISAHNMMTWMVERNRLLCTMNESYETILTRKVVRQFLEETQPEQRRFFVEEVFDRLNELGIETTGQLGKGGMPLLIKVLLSLNEMDGDAKTVAGKMLKTLSENIGSDLFRSLSQKADSFRKKTGDLGENIESLIREYRPILNKKKEDEA